MAAMEGGSRISTSPFSFPLGMNRYVTIKPLFRFVRLTMQRLFSGIQPSGNLHLGNYLGAIKQWVGLQDQYEAIFCVVDLHAITVPQDPVELRKKVIEAAKMYLAAGIDPAKSTIFIQSHVPAHTELGWILNTITQNGELTRMTQFKDKTGFDIEKFDKFLEKIGEKKYIQELVQKAVDENMSHHFNQNELEEDIKVAASIQIMFKQGMEVGFDRGVNNVKKYFKEIVLENFGRSGVGLFDYPVLMAADILLYDTAVVPVGEDQKQHIELTRDLAQRFNSRFGETFVVPEPLITKEGARIMGLDDPSKKMSKSAASEYNYIALADDADTVRRKIKKAVTDSGSEIVYSDDKPALKNLINIYTLLSGKSTSEIEAMYVGRGYGDFKTDLAEVVVNFLAPFQERMNGISDEEALAILKAGAEKVQSLARAKVRQVYDKVGLISC